MPWKIICASGGHPPPADGKIEAMESCASKHQDPSPLTVERLDEPGFQKALAEIQGLLGTDTRPTLEAVIHGVHVHLDSNSPHWRLFWSSNWFAPAQWATLTGRSAHQNTRVHLYAVAPGTEAPPWAGYSSEHHTAILIGDVPYGALRSLALRSTARLLADEQAVHLLPGLCFRRNGHGVLVVGSANQDLAPIQQSLLLQQDVHLIAPDGVFIRYGLVRMVDGVTLLPTMVFDEKGNTLGGYRLFPWLDTYGYQEPRADARCVTLEGQEEFCFARDLDLARAPEPFAFPLEKAWYVPAQLLAARPGLVAPLLKRADPDPHRLNDKGSTTYCELENVPAPAPDLLESFGDGARQTLGAWRSSSAELAQTQSTGVDETAFVMALCRLQANPNSRAMVTPQQLAPGRAGGLPWQPYQIQELLAVDGEALVELHPNRLAAMLFHTDDPLSPFADEQPNQTLFSVLQRAMG
jgi:hypothetical protein